MKNKLFLLIILALMVSIVKSYGQNNIKITLRPYLRAGINLLPPSMEDLEYVGDWSDAVINKNPLCIGAGSQFKVALNKVDLGVDIGGGTVFVNEVIYDEVVGIATYLDKESHIYILFFGEFKLKDPFFVQFGLGPNISPWYYEYYYDSVSYSDEQNSGSGVGFNLAFMSSAGVDFDINERTNLFLLGRLDGILRYGMMFPFTINFGISFNLGNTPD